MKKYFLLLVMFLGATVVTVAQDDDSGGGKNEGGRIEALKIAYITKKLDLSTEEAQKFWPIYNKYIQEVRKTRIDARLNKDKEIDTEEKLLNIRKKYSDEFNKALTKDKVNSFFRVEKEFGIYLQKELMERRQQQMNNRRRLKNN
jgi:hypothetical protein